MASEIKVDTVSEKTSANGVTIDGVALKDGAVTATGVVTGTAFTAGSAVLAEAELELLDGLTAGTAIASKVVTTDASIDTTGMRNLTISGELDAATGDFSGIVNIAGVATFEGAAKTTGVHTFAAGSVSAPSITRTGDLDTGICFPSANRMDFATAGNTTLSLDANGGPTWRPIANGHFVFNEGSVDADFRVESNANAYNIFSDGGNNRLIFMKATNAIGTAGTTIENDGEVVIARSGNAPLNVNRAGDGGVIVNLSQAGTVAGTISESGGTVSYNAFCGSHWSRLADNSKPTILRGTVMESISTLLTWYQVEFSVPTLDENGANVIDENGDNVVSIEKKSITLPEGKSVGDTITHTWPSDGKDYSAKIIQEENERLPMCKISDTADSKAVYGVFMDWDNDDDTVNDMYVAGIGAFVVRIHKDETVAIGNWLVSKGDGTAKVLAGNTAITADVQSSLIGKVTSTTKTHTHADDSYCVPCTLHCG